MNRTVSIVLLLWLAIVPVFAASDTIAEPAKKPVQTALRLSGMGGMMLKDGKVDSWLGKRPLLGGQFAVEFLPTGRWHSLQQWNNASVGIGLTYLNLSNDDKLGHAIGLQGYINQPFYNGRHFAIGVRPSVGIAAVTKTYMNTLPAGVDPYSRARDDAGNYIANWSIGSIINAYLAMELFMDFPIIDGWAITLNGGWHHISNGSIMHPNAGYNMFMGALGVRWTVQTLEEWRAWKEYEAPEPDVPRHLYDGVDKHWAVELSATGGVKQNYYRDNYPKMQFFAAATVKAAAYWVPVSIFRIGVGIDAFYDGYYRCVNDEFSSLPGNENAPVTYFGKTYLKQSKLENCFRVGISLQPEFIIGHLTAGIHVGFYVFDPIKNLEPYVGKKDWDKGQGAKEMDEKGTPLDRGIFYKYDFTDASNYQDGWCYMQFVLKYHVSEHFFVQLGLKTHGVRAEFIDAGLGIAF